LLDELDAAGEADFDGLLKEALAWYRGVKPASVADLDEKHQKAFQRVKEQRFHGKHFGIASERDLTAATKAAEHVREALRELERSPGARSATEAYILAADDLAQECASCGEVDYDGLLRQCVQVLEAPKDDSAETNASKAKRWAKNADAGAGGGKGGAAEKAAGAGAEEDKALKRLAVGWAGPKKWHSGVRGADGTILFIPCNADAVTTVAGGALQSFGKLGWEKWKWNGAAVAGKKVFAMPSHGDTVLVIDGESCRTVGRFPGKGSKWNAACVAGDGTVIGLPFDSPSLLRINPDTEEARLVGNFGNGKYKYRTGVTAGNGCVYGIPYSAESVLVVDGNETRLLGRFGSAPGKWSGSVLGADGCVYGLPLDHDRVLRVDPVAGTADVFGESVGGGKGKWRGGAVAPNGKIIAPPYGSRGVLIVDGPNVRVVGDLGPGKDKYAGAVVGADGLVYGVPCNADAVVVIDPETEAVTTLEPLVGASTGKWCDGLLGDDGHIYCVPMDDSDVLVIDTRPGRRAAAAGRKRPLETKGKAKGEEKGKSKGKGKGGGKSREKGFWGNAPAA
jgi:hypothetical protein